MLEGSRVRLSDWRCAAVFSVVVACLSCGSGSRRAATEPAPPAASPDHVSRLASFGDYWAVAGEGGEVKYLVALDDTSAAAPFSSGPCLFQNTARYRYHIQFLRTLSEFATLGTERYEDMVLHANSRTMWGGGLKPLNSTPHPISGQPGTLAFTAYLDDSDAADFLRSVSALDQHLKSCAPFLQDSLAFLPEGPAQGARSRAALESLRARGVAVLDPDAIRTGVSAVGYSEAEGYGYLRIVRPGSEVGLLSPLDILVVDGAPNELDVVAGLLTARPQSIASHVNLRLREKSRPNASVPDIFDNEVLLGFENQLVHLVVQANDVTLTSARLGDAEAWWKAARPVLDAVDADLQVKQFRPLAELVASDALAYGTKAANLGELHRVLTAPHVPDGFAVPFGVYSDFLSSNGLDAKIDALVAETSTLLDAARKRAALASVRQAIVATSLGAEQRDALREAVLASFGEAGLRLRLRFRSSANSEDLAGASGAGLYDSKSGCLADDLDADELGPSLCLTPETEAYYRSELARHQAEFAAHPDHGWLSAVIEDLQHELTREKSAYAALKKVWASLWNERAFDERVFYGLDQRRAYMAVAVHSAQVAEQLEAVALTNLEPTSSEPLFRVVSQVGEMGVVQPRDPGAQPEVSTFRRTAENSLSALTLVTASSLSGEATSLWGDAALQELGSLLFAVQDHFAGEVYAQFAPVSLDVEVDLSAAGVIIVKQVRPYRR